MIPVYRLDNEIFRTIHVGWNNPALDAFFWFFSHIGLGQAQALIAIALLFRRDTRYYVLPLLATVLASGFVAQLIKAFLERDRPSNLAFAQPHEGHLANSFPSGHTTSSFAFAFMLLFITVGTRRAWIGWLALWMALMVGISRIYRGVHWPSDVLAGMFFGCATAALVFIVLDRLGHFLHLDEPEATLTGRETSEAEPA